jgi:hypothetical protein
MHGAIVNINIRPNMHNDVFLQSVTPTTGSTRILFKVLNLKKSANICKALW